MAVILKAFNAKINNNALAEDKLPKKLKVLGWGTNETNDGNVILNEESMLNFDEYQRKAGRDKSVALDFDHNTVSGSKAFVMGAPKYIAAYGDPVIVKGDGLYLTNIQWTDTGKKMASNYKDLSPAAVLNDRGVIMGLDSVALTPHGAVRDLEFFSSTGFDNKLLNEMSAKNEYNKEGANPGVKLTPAGPVAKELDAEAAINDEEALEEMKELEEHEKAELGQEDSDAAKPNVPGTKIFTKDADADADASCHDADAAACYDADAESDEDEDEYAGMEDKMKEHRGHVYDMGAEDHYSKYGDVKYADPSNHKYPIDNEKHVRAAWSYINMPKNASKVENISAVKGRIKAAAKKYGIEIADEKPETKTMSADNPSYPDAYQTAIENPYKNMNTTVLRKMAAEVGMDGESDQEKVLFAFLAKFEGLKAELAQQITKKGNTQEGGLKQFSAEIDTLKQEIVSLKNRKAAEDKENDASQRAEIERLAAREGKVIPLSADERKNIDINLLRSIVKNQPRSVPTVATLRTLSVQDGEQRKPSREKAVAAFESMLVK